MYPGDNPVELAKASKAGDPLRIRDDVPRLIEAGWRSLTPADKDLLKWLGIFFRKPTPGQFMMRIRMPNGFATSRQLRTIADLSRRLGNNILDITTRQQLELRGYTLESVPEIFSKLRGVDLRSLQTGMDNLRNFNGCPLAGLTPDELLDASPVVMALDRLTVGAEGNSEFANLPRKMNVTVTGCLANCTHNESQDIALIPARRQARHGFNVLVGGKMGSGGFTIASALDVFVEPEGAPEVVLELVRIFRDHGPRGPRTKTRFAFLVEAWGVARLRGELVARLGHLLETAGEDMRWSSQTDHLGVSPQRQPGMVAVGLCIPTGRLHPDQLDELARLAETYGTSEVRWTIAQDAILPNVPVNTLDALLKEPFLERFSPNPSPFFRQLVACTGTDFCNLAVIETKSHAIELSKALEERLGTAFDPMSIYWSGCPAGCGNHQAADIGLRGMKVNLGGKSVDAVAIYVGGRTGREAKAGRLLMEMVPCDEALPDVIVTILKHLELFKQVERDSGAKERILMVPAMVDEEAEE